jgi:hypothetical protein
MKNNYVIKIIFVFSLLVSIVSCGTKNEAAASNFDSLCIIYKEIATKKTNLDNKVGELAERVNEKMPDFYKNYFLHVQQMDANKRYAFIKHLAEKAKGSAWDCAIMKSFYENNFK